MNIQCKYGRIGTGHLIRRWGVVSAFIVAIAWPGFIADAPALAANQLEDVGSWIDQILKGEFKRGQPLEPAMKPGLLSIPPTVLRLTLDEAMALFLKQNLDLIIANYGIDAAKARQITARLFPNPTLSVITFSAYTQGCNIQKCGAVAPTLSQLFEVAGRRGYRMESAALATKSVEAAFEDTVRQLGFTLKETYFRLQRRRGHLKVDQDVQDVLINLLKTFTPDGKRGSLNLDRVRLGVMTVNADSEVLRDLQVMEEVTGDLRTMLRIPPDVELDLATDLSYRPVEPDFARLLQYALENRPDIRAKRLSLDRQKTELQLAQAIRYPNVTAEGGYMMQGPKGPDNQQQFVLSLSADLPVFDRNQGRIAEAAVGIKSAEADIEKTVIQIQNEVAVAYRRFLHARKLVEASNGALEKISLLFRVAQQAFIKGELGILDLENTRRSYADVEETHLEAVFGYQQNWLRLEWAAGHDLMF